MDQSIEEQGYQDLCKWASEKRIQLDTIKACKELGYTSLEALECLSKEDLKKATVPIPVGQQRLLLKAVAGLGAPEGTHSPASLEANGDRGASASQDASNPANQEPNINPVQNEGAALPVAGPGPNLLAGEDAFIQRLAEQLGRAPAHPGMGVHAQPSVPSGPPNPPAPPITGTLSWQDPQVYIKSVTGSKDHHYNIVDFVDAHLDISEKVVSSGEGFDLVYRSGSRKPKLENLTISQWSGANIAILYRLYQDGTLGLDNIFDYLSYTTFIYGLISSHELGSVYQFDREYRRLQGLHKFRWGTSIGHLAPGYLRLRNTGMGHSAHAQKAKPVNRPDRPPQAPRMGGASYQSHNSEGKVICKNFNIKYGCTYQGCKF
jgi:hypothetical protein